jgi:hypothetical protein
VSFLEFQISVPHFLTVQRNYLRLLGFCPPLLPTVAGVQIVVDRIDIGPSSLRHDEDTEFGVFLENGGERVPTKRPATGKKTKLAQDIILRLTTDSEVRANPNGVPTLVPLPLTLVYELSAYSVEDDCILSSTLDKVELGPLPPLPAPLPASLPPAVTAALENFLTTNARLFAPSGSVKMGLDRLKLGVMFLNAGLAVDTTGQTLAIRVQVGGSSWYLDTPWSNFYRGFFSDRRQGRDWALFVEAGYITESIKSILGRQIPRDDDLEAYPGCTYAADAGKAVFDVDALLIYHAVQIDPLDIDITAQADPHVVLRLWVETSNWLSAEIDFSGLVQAKGFLSNFVLSLADLFGIPVEEILLRLVGSAAVPILQDAPVDNVKQTSDTTIRVDKRIAIPSVPGAVQTAVTDLLPLPDGVSLAGSMSVSELTSAIATVRVRQFKMGAPDVSCGPASIALVALFRSDPSAFAVLHASAQIVNQGTAPLKLCQPPTVEPANGPMKPRDVRVDAAPPPIDLSFHIAAPDAVYYQNPYPIDVLVRTNGGTRLIRLDPLPFVDADAMEQLATELLVKIGNCEQLVGPWFHTHRGYNPRWSPRPPGDLVVVHQWKVAISGLPPGEGAQLLDAERRVLVSAISTGTPVRLVTVTAPTERGQEVSIVRTLNNAHGIDARLGQQDSEQEVHGRGLQVRQTNLVVNGAVALHGACRRIVTATLSGTPAALLLLDDKVVAFDVLATSPAASLAMWPGEFSGMLRSRGGIVLYGEDGMASIDVSGQLTRTLIDVPVLDAASGPDGVFAVTGDRVLVLSPELRPRGEIELPEVTSVGHASGRLVVGHRSGIDLVDGVDTGDRSCIADGQVVSLTPASVMYRGALLATFADSTAMLVVPREDGLHEIVRYDNVPWFKNTVRIGDRLARVGTTTESLELLHVGTSVML